MASTPDQTSLSESVYAYNMSPSLSSNIMPSTEERSASAAFSNASGPSDIETVSSEHINSVNCKNLIFSNYLIFFEIIFFALILMHILNDGILLSAKEILQNSKDCNFKTKWIPGKIFLDLAHEINKSNRKLRALLERNLIDKIILRINRLFIVEYSFY